MTWFANVFPVSRAREVARVLICLAVFTAWTAEAASKVSLAWDPSADSSVAGYKIYYGVASRNYTATIDVGKVTSAAVAVPADNTTYFFAATTYDDSGAESDFSNEATYFVAPPPPPPAPTNAPSSNTSSSNAPSLSEPPTLAAIGNLTFDYNGAAQVVGLTGISPGLVGGKTPKLTFTITSSNTKVVPAPKVSYTSPNPTGSLTVKPAANVSGTATITVKANNGGKSNNIVVQTFTVIVLPNQPPTLDPIANLTFAYNGAAQTNLLTGIGTGAAGEAQKLTVTATSSNTKLVPAPKVSYTSPNATGSLTVKPAANMSGTATITVKVNDGGKSSNVVSRTFTVTVLPNTAPTLDAITNLTFAYNGAAQTVALTGIGSGSSNEVQKLTVTATSSNTKLIPAPKVSYTSPNPTGSLTVKPAANMSGTATITVKVNDGGKSSNVVSQTFTVTVLPNATPTLDPIADVTLEYNSAAQTVALTGISSGSSDEVQKLTVTATSSNTKLIPAPKVSYTSPNATGSLTVKPAANMSGTATITVKVNDGGKSSNIVSRTFTVTVLPNTIPTLDAITNNLTFEYNGAAQIVPLTGISAGASGEVQKLIVTATSSNTKLIPAPKVSYTNPATTGSLTVQPAMNMSGTATITVTVNDSGKSNNVIARAFTVTVLPNQPPTLDVAQTNLTFAYNGAPQTNELINLGAGASGEIQKLTITATSDNPKVVPNPKVNYANPQTNGFLVVQPAANMCGTATITVKADDGGKSNNVIIRTFTVTVLTNQSPTLDPIADVTLEYNSATQTVPLTGISAGAGEEIQRLTVTVSSSNTKLFSTLKTDYTSPNATGSLTVKPAANTSGSATVTIKVNDGGTSNNIVAQTFTVTVLPKAVATTATQQSQSAAPTAVGNLADMAATLTTSVNAGGPFSVTVNGVTGAQYVVEVSSDLINWTPVQTNTAPFTFIDEQSGQFDKRFYRATYLPPP